MGQRLPGYEVLETVTPRNILYGSQDIQEILKPGGVTLDGTNGIDGGNTNTYDIRAGWALGRITASGLYVPCKRTQVNGTSGAATEVVVDNSYPFVVGDVISIGSDTDITITAIDYSTHTLTIASTTVADNEPVVAQDGSEICRGFLFDFARLRNKKNTAAANIRVPILIAGKVNKAKLFGDIDAIEATLSSHFLGDVQIWSNNVRVA